MPNYGVAQAGASATSGLNLVCLQTGDSYKLFDAESPTAPQASVAVNIGPGPGAAPNAITFTAHWATAPTAQCDIQGSNVDLDSQYQSLHSFNNVQDSYYTDNSGFRYYRVNLLSQTAGGALTVIAQL